jgi:hypothetical protein
MKTILKIKNTSPFYKFPHSSIRFQNINFKMRYYVLLSWCILSSYKSIKNETKTNRLDAIDSA